MDAPQSPHVEAEARFDHLWEQTLRRFERGECEADEFLSGVQPDHRMGITLLARLPEAVLEAVRPRLAVLAAAFPEQYVQPESDLHVTILSIEPARESFAPRAGQVEAILEAVDAEVRGTPPFECVFRGLSAGSSAAFFCGYPVGAALNEFRERIRRACHDRSAGFSVESRYPNIGAHVTVLRFLEPRISAGQFALLKQLRSEPLAHAALTHLELVQNDWYMRLENLTHYASWVLTSPARSLP